jgi:hypothetical protein
MNRVQRYLAVLAGLGGTLLAVAAAAPAAFATLPPPEPAPPVPVKVHTVVIGGMPTLIAVGVALAAAALAVLFDQSWRRHGGARPQRRLNPSRSWRQAAPARITRSFRAVRNGETAGPGTVDGHAASTAGLGS